MDLIAVALLVWVALAALVGFVAGVIAGVFGGGGKQKGMWAPVNGSLTTQPTLIGNDDATFVYTVTAGAGKLPGAQVTFTFGRADPIQITGGGSMGTAGGGQSTTVTTDANGEAKITVRASGDGTAQLTTTLSYGGASGSDNPVDIECDDDVPSQ